MYSKDDIVVILRNYYHTNNKVPRKCSWVGDPPVQYITKLFGSWNDAMAASGLWHNNAGNVINNPSAGGYDGGGLLSPISTPPVNAPLRMTKLCGQCGTFIPNTVMIDGIRKNLQNRSRCLDCVPWGSKLRHTPEEHATIQKDAQRERNRIKSRRFYHDHKKTLTERVSDHRKKVKLKLMDLFGGGCVICGYNKVARNMVFHHINPDLKSFSISENATQRYKLDVLVNEVRKCVLLCHNCHGEVHDGIVDVDLFIEKGWVGAVGLEPTTSAL